MRSKKSQKIRLSDYYKEKYKKSYAEAKATETDEINLEIINKKDLGRYTLKAHIVKSPWLKSGRPASSAIKWLYTEVFKNPAVYRHNKMLLFQGNLYAFEYKNPKFKDSLDFFDKYPLVLSLGPVVTKLGIRNIGFNLHLLPIKVRVLVLCQIFEFYKKLYRYQIFKKRENRPVNINYHYIVSMLEKYGVKFCVRMYIPARQNQIIKFGYKDWAKAIFIPSRGYSKIRAQELEKKWKEHLNKLGYKASYNRTWKSIFSMVKQKSS